jgi:energy-coupling factor transport system ATP-binding protein
VIRFEHVTVTYPGVDRPVLDAVDLHVPEGELCLVVGRTGAGKSTLLGAINGLVPHFTGGTLAGRVTVAGRDTRTHRPRDLAHVVGMVVQDPLNGFVADTVEDELAYAMEQLAVPAGVMRKRVEETLDLLGLEPFRSRPMRTLSGGQQQRVAIGAVLTAHPRVLVLDEPTSALDPAAAEEVLAALTRLVHDLGITVVMAEHRLERVVEYADVVVTVDSNGHVVSGPPPVMMCKSAVAPPVVRLGSLLGWDPLPLSVRDARRLLRERPDPLPAAQEAPRRLVGAAAITASGLVVRYGDVVAVAAVDLTLASGVVTALMGRNGSGKSSLLWALQGTGQRSGGRVLLADGVDPAMMTPADRRRHVTLVPQNPTDLLYLATVDEECALADSESGRTSGTTAGLLDDIAPGIGGGTHPRDLSEGQRLALALAVQLCPEPRVLLLDEPTRGLDEPGKHRLAEMLRRLAADGHAVAVATHDVEFVAGVADRVVVLADGEIVADGATAEVVVASPVFAPQVAKITHPDRWLTVAQLRDALQLEVGP